MTSVSGRSLQAAILISAVSLLFSSCIEDECTQYYSYKLFKPVYMSYDQLRRPVLILPAQNMVNVGKIYVLSPYILTNEVNKGIHVIDNTDPSSPKNVAFISIPGNLDMAVKDNILYADSYIDLVGIDITNPMSAHEVWRTRDVFEQRSYNGWVGDETLGVITDWMESDTVVESDCTSPGIWLFEDGFAISSGSSGSSGGGSGAVVTPGIGIAGSMTRFAVADNHLYCLITSSMSLYDVTSPAEPVPQGSVFTGWGVETLFPYGDNLFVGTNTGVSIFDNSNPAAPTLLSTVTHVTGCDPVVVQDDYAYSTIHSGNFCGQNFNELNVIDIKNLKEPFIAKTYTLLSPYGLGIDGDRLFVCDDTRGLKVFDASDPLQLVLLEELPVGTSRDVIAYSGWLLLVSLEGIYQFDYTGESLSQLSFLPIHKE